MTNAAFFVYLFASCIGVAVIALLLLIFKVQQGKDGQALWKDPLLLFVICTFLMGLFYFGERFYTDNFAAKAGWGEAERGLDLLLYSAQIVFWYWYLRCETGQRDNRKLTFATNGILIGMFALQLVTYLFIIDEHYYIASAGLRTAATWVDGIYIPVQIILMVVYCRIILREISGREARSFLMGISLLLLIDFIGETIYVMLLYCSSPMLDQWYYAFDLVSVLFLLINILTVVYIYRCRIRQMIAEPAIPDEGQRIEQLTQTFQENGLSEREIEVAVMLLDGSSYDQIAEQLIISKYTVKRHAHNIYQKLEVANKVELIGRFK